MGQGRPYWVKVFVLHQGTIEQLKDYQIQRFLFMTLTSHLTMFKVTKICLGLLDAFRNRPSAASH